MVAMAKATRAFTIRPATHDDLNAIVGLYNWANESGSGISKKSGGAAKPVAS